MELLFSIIHRPHRAWQASNSEEQASAMRGLIDLAKHPDDSESVSKNCFKLVSTLGTLFYSSDEQVVTLACTLSWYNLT